MRKKSISVRDIATECEVAIGTVSRVINNKPGVREDLKQRVLEVIRKHNYNPYANVPLVNKIRTRTLKVVMPYYESEIFLDGFYSKGFEGIKRAASERGFDITLTGEHRFNEEEFQTHKESRLPNASEGVIFFCPHKDWDGMIRKVQKWRIPAALVNRTTQCSDVIVVREKSRVHSMKMMIDHLKALGHRRIGCVSPAAGKIIHNDENFQQAVEQAGLGFSTALPIHTPMVNEELQRLIKEKRLPDAFFVFGDHLAVGVLKYLQKQGLRIPADVAVVGYSNIDLGRYTTPELTTIDSHIDRMAGLAAKLLIDRIEGSEFGEMEVEIEGGLVVRESCGAHLGTANHADHANKRKKKINNVSVSSIKALSRGKKSPGNSKRKASKKKPAIR